MKLVRTVIYFLLLLAVLLAAMAFAALNPVPLTLDLAFTAVEMLTSLAMTLAFATGWLFGVLCAALVLLRFAGERRRLRRATEVAEAEVRALRSLPGTVTE